MKKKICIFCSSAETQGAIKDIALTVCSSFANRDWELVWGGSDVGLMKYVSDTVKASGARIHGVSLDRLSVQLQDAKADTMYIARTLAERVDRMIDMSDAFLVMPGGSGTLDEFAHVLELRRLNYHQKPIVLLNIDGFYDGLMDYFERVFEMKMQYIFTNDGHKIPAPIEKIVYVTQDASSTLSILSEALSGP